jgi:hypothetical protein
VLALRSTPGTTLRSTIIVAILCLATSTQAAGAPKFIVIFADDEYDEAPLDSDEVFKSPPKYACFRFSQRFAGCRKFRSIAGVFWQLTTLCYSLGIGLGGTSCGQVRARLRGSAAVVLHQSSQSFVAAKISQGNAL